MVEIPSRGVLIGIEGIDAAGKRTQSSLLDSWLRSRKISAKTISFPDYSTVLGGEIKAFLLGRRPYSSEVRHMLFAANRWERKQEIENLLETSDAVIVNRYTESNLAFGIANGLKTEWLVNLEQGLPRTDLVLVLDASPSVLYNRKGAKKDTYESNVGLQEKARDAYLDLAGKFGWKVVDASESMENTHKTVVEAVAGLLRSKGRTI